MFSIECVLYVTLWNVSSKENAEKKNAAHRRGPGTHSQSPYVCIYIYIYIYISANSDTLKVSIHLQFSSLAYVYITAPLD